MDVRILKAFLNFLQLFLRTKASTQAPLKFFLWLQKHCSKHLGASTTSGLYNARRIKVIGCLEKKERNENSDVRKFHSQQRIRAVLTQTSLFWTFATIFLPTTLLKWTKRHAIWFFRYLF